MQDETFQLIVNTAQKTLSKNNLTPERGGKPLKVYTTNMLIFSRHQTAYYYAYAKGIKTGHTSQAGYCLVRRREKGRQADLRSCSAANAPRVRHSRSPLRKPTACLNGVRNPTNMKLVEKGAEILQTDFRAPVPPKTTSSYW